MPEGQPVRMPNSAAPMSLMEKLDLVTNLMFYPALTVQVFLRKKTGFRNLKPKAILVLTILLLLIARFMPQRPITLSSPKSNTETVATVPPEQQIPYGADAPFPSNWQKMTYQAQQQWWSQHRLTPQQIQQHEEQKAADAKAKYQATLDHAAFVKHLAYWSLVVFALAFFAWSLVQRRQRWRDICAGVRWHTRSRGVSWLAFLPIREDWVIRFVDPAACFLAGLLCLLFSLGLGLWLLFAAFALYVVEQTVHDKQLENDLDLLDTILEAEVSSETAKHFKANPQAAQVPIQQTGGIPTGVEPELQNQVRRRRGSAESSGRPAPVEPPARENAAAGPTF